jgi:hypothetical protein
MGDGWVASALSAPAAYHRTEARGEGVRSRPALAPQAAQAAFAVNSRGLEPGGGLLTCSWLLRNFEGGMK